ncbi:period circadian protein homolog 1 [Ornithorhynchus anatinus]|uniref:period circadian protein homolog 1 n=1 Tax=Ornithorhynchus anatinus TaxID=9258 RepID=UPI0010A7B8DC|nr:period circadian protein homolog 1 [Ornithorhynchus anatinus]
MSGGALAGGPAGPGPGPGERFEGVRPPGPGSADDTDANSNGSSGNESNGRESRGASQRSSHSSSSGHGKDSALLRSTGSSKSTNSQSPSPPSSSAAYSLLSASSEQDNPSTSGCSSEQSARVKTQKELMKALKELKQRLPGERRGTGRSGTLATLQYALSCVKQVQANQDYYQQWSLEEGPPGASDLSCYTLEELESISSEYTLSNQDTFSAAVSFLTGRILYASDQAAPLLRCRPERLRGTRFSELLAPQDVAVFYGSTAPSRLPRWGAAATPASGPLNYAQEKAIYCRIRGGPPDQAPHYQPFRLTPYAMKLRPTDGVPGQPCCLLIAERVHSGYEAPRIPPDKRIFTTRHTTGCVFQDVDERAAPLLGYLPQDLVGAPVLLFLHPDDRPLMLAIHKKILQLAGQPFDHSPIRFCARNGDYLTLDTSWAGFVHPWSRKVTFVLGRHKVRTGPLNEDVFAPPPAGRAPDPGVQELSERIHRLLLQPVHGTSPTGPCGVGVAAASPGASCSPGSSSDSNGGEVDGPRTPAPLTFQQICKDVHLVKHQGQQLFIESRARRARPPRHRPRPVPEAIKPSSLSDHPPGSAAGPGRTPSPPTVVTPGPEDSGRKEPSNCSYQQINCLDGIIRYLESCSVPSTVKRKCGSSSYTASSASDDDKQKAAEDQAVGPRKDPSDEPSRPRAGVPRPPLRKEPVVGGPLTPLALPNKAESVVSITSQCSFSSTIVHVGDKKPPESDIVMLEEAASSGPAPEPGPALTADPYRSVGLTKEVLSLHTQQEEQAFLTRFRDLSRLRVLDRESGLPSPPGQPGRRGCRLGPHHHPGRRQGRSKAKRPRPLHTAGPDPAAPPLPFPALLPTYPLPVYHPRAGGPPPPAPQPFPSPLVTPMVALVLPNYLLPPPPPPVPGYPFGAPLTPPAPAPGSGSPSPPPPAASPSLARPTSPLFDSRCSSPLQLNLLQLEEPPRADGGPGGPGGGAGDTPRRGADEEEEEEEEEEDGEECGAGMAEVNESSNQDALSGSSDLLELLLQEDSHSGSGSAASGSLGSGSRSGSRGRSTSASGTRGSESSHTSKYFGSIDSSEAEPAGGPAGAEPGEQVIKYVLQDPIWLLMANADHKVMMTYQIPARDAESVLQRDLERLRSMQKQQPRFSEDQRRELGAVHPWVRGGLLPRAIDITACVDCGSSGPGPPYTEEEEGALLEGLLEPMEEGGATAPETAMEEEEGAGPGAAPETAG